MSRAKIPFPERFDEMIDYKQNEVIRDLKMKDVLCTWEDWVSSGRLDHTMRDDLDQEGQALYITMKGVTYREPEVTANKIMHHVRKFPTDLLGPSNKMIGTIIANAFETIAPPSHAT